MHTAGGHVSYLFAAADRKAPTGSMTDADRVQFYNTVTAAVGTYKIDGDKVLFHVDEAGQKRVARPPFVPGLAPPGR